MSDSFTMDLNYWRINFENLIVTEDGNVILNNDIADGFINDPRITLFPGAPNEVCEVTGTAPTSPTCVTGDDIALFTLSYINQDFQKTSGLDFNFRWQFSAGGSDWGIGLAGTYVDTYELTSEGEVFDGVGSYNGANFGFELPELRANVRFDWMRGDHRYKFRLNATPAPWQWRRTMLFAVEPSNSTIPSVPTPAAARYMATGEPRPPAPMHSTLEALRRLWPSMATSGMIRCLEYLRTSSRSRSSRRSTTGGIRLASLLTCSPHALFGLPCPGERGTAAGHPEFLGGPHEPAYCTSRSAPAT